MICFEVSVNGKRVCRAGIGEYGVLTSIVTWVKRHISNMPPQGDDPKEFLTEEIRLEIGGLETIPGEIGDHLAWSTPEVGVGDEVRIKIVDSPKPDTPNDRRPSDRPPKGCSAEREDVDVEPLVPFDYSPLTRIVYGEGSLIRLGELACELGGKRVLLVTDPGLEAAGHPAKAIESLMKSGLEVTLFDRVIENPTTREVEACTDVARNASIDLIVGLGGGSSMDTAKGCNFILTNGGRMEDYWGTGKATRPMLPMIAVPTTTGTGSECQSYALITHPETHRKMACGDPKAAPRIALLDPLLTLTQPHMVTLCSGIDAIAHAVETAVTTKRNPISDLYSFEAFRLLLCAFERVLIDPTDQSARGEMLLGAAFAGIAIENSMLGAAHAAANPLTARYDLVHGKAVGLMLPAVVRYNLADSSTAGIYASLAIALGLGYPWEPPQKAAEKLAAHLESLLETAGLPVRLAQAGIPQGDLPLLAKMASEQWTGTFNPHPMGVEDYQSLYQGVFQ